MRKLLFAFICLLILPKAWSQPPDSVVIRSLFDEALVNGEAYENLRVLCKDIGGRLSGSEQAAEAVQWGFALMQQAGLDKVHLQEITVPHWERGAEEWMRIAGDTTHLAICALGGSVATEGVLRAPVVMFSSLAEMKAAPEDHVKGKVVFLNRPLNAKLIDTFNAYGQCGNERWSGAAEASAKGAVAVIVRSLTLANDDYPHTGVMDYESEYVLIPAVAMGIQSARKLSQHIEKHVNVTIELKLSCRHLPDAISHNVIGEITGAEAPEKVILVGGHLDSWDLGEGAHDDGAGVVQALEVLRLFKAAGVRPRHTIRCVMYMNEENGNQGGQSYAQAVALSGEQHIAAMESDRGGFTPRGFHLEGFDHQLNRMQAWMELLEPYNLHILQKGYGGVDIGPLRDGKIALIGFVPDSQRYFDYHHTANDVFEHVNERELHLGAASMAAMIYLIDRHGFGEEIKR